MAKTMVLAGPTNPLDDALGLEFPLPPRDPKWLNEPGPATAGRGQLQQWTRAFRESLGTLRRGQRDADEMAGRLSHVLGTYLRQFRGCSAWETLELESFEAFCVEHLGISQRHALRLVFFAAITTEEQAAHGLRKCLAGYALAVTLGEDGLGALIPTRPGWKEPATWAARLGEPVAFLESSASRLERLTVRATTPALPEAPAKRLFTVAETRREVIGRVAKRHPALEKLEVRSFVREGQARVAHRNATTVEEFAALRALYDALGKA